MAKAAEDAAVFAQGQYHIAGWALGALIATLFATLVAALAAVCAVRISSDTAKKQLRAYVSLAPGGIQYGVRNNELYVLVVQKNNGPTPAKKVRFFGRAEICEHPLRDFVFPAPEYGPGTNVVHPGHQFRVPCPIISDEIRALNATPGRRLYFMGQVSYEDIYGVPQTTRVCWSYERLDRFVRRRTSQPGFEYTTHDNCAS